MQQGKANTNWQTCNLPKAMACWFAGHW